MIRIAEEYYTALYTPSKTDIIRQQQLLRNIDTRISAEDRRKLDSALSLRELTEAVFQQKNNRSPGPDGITAEFYKAFWYLIQRKYLAYINASKQSQFGEHKNTSVTTIIYKRKGETYVLANYRPISLINVDLKILTKALLGLLSC